MLFVFLKYNDSEKIYLLSDIEVRLTDTFGLVMLEAMVGGLPMAACPVTGPRDLLGDTKAAFMDEKLSRTVEQASK